MFKWQLIFAFRVNQCWHFFRGNFSINFLKEYILMNMRTTSFTRGRKYVVPALLAMSTVGIISNTANAGSGTFQSGNFNFCVSVRFNATAAQLQQIQDTFQNGSQVLADATDGQHRFGIITLVNDSGASHSAEYWVKAGSGRAGAPSGHYGRRGLHGNYFINSNFQALFGADGDAYAIAHEHAHLAYKLGDEYFGPSGMAECASATAKSPTLNYSLMDHFLIRGGRAFRGRKYTLNEFCVASNHDPDHDTWQHSRHEKSAWEVLDTHPKFPATKPAGLPVDTPPPAHTVNFVDGFKGVRVMLLLDRSGSMSFNDRITFVKSGGKVFVDVMDADDALGVASFSSSTSVNFSLNTNLSGAKTAIDSLNASGPTNIGGGLLASLGQFTTQPNRSCDEIIVLLSDGDHTTGTAPASVIPVLQGENVTVMSVGVGSGLSTSGETALQNVATQTGGKFYRLNNDAAIWRLPALMLSIQSETTGRGLLEHSPVITISSQETKEIPISVEAGTKSTLFAVTVANLADDITLSLRSPSGAVITEFDALNAPRSPSGAVITEFDALNAPDIEFISESNVLIFRVQTPEEGIWNMVISASTVTTGLLEILAFAEHEGVDLHVTVEKYTLVFPEVVEINAIPTFGGERVVGATVTGIATRPDGSEVPIILYDDGLKQHADAIPNDGIYATRFDNYNDDGTYTFELTVVNTDGMTYAGEELFLDEPSNAKPVPSFTRKDSATVVVTGVPDFVMATVEIGPETLNLKSKGKFITAYLELPDGFDVANIALDSVAITAVDGVDITPIGSEPKPTEIDDFDNDGIPDLMIKFSRSAVQQAVTAGMRELQLEGVVSGTLFIGKRSVGVIMPDRIPTNNKGKKKK
jgi:hypothetical protein